MEVVKRDFSQMKGIPPRDGGNSFLEARGDADETESDFGQT